MMALLVAVTLTATVVGSGVAAGPLVHRAAPALMRAPRLAVAVLLGVLLIWLAGLAAMGPMLAWGFSSPNGLLPGNSGVICQRCLDAANPLPAGMAIQTSMPTVVLLMLPVVLIGTMLIGGYRYSRQHTKQRAQLLNALQAGAYQTWIAGQAVTIVPHAQPTAFALAQPRWGIVVSTALLETLTDDELTAVITHEAAHVRQRHHLIVGALHGGVSTLRWVPLIATMKAAIPLYLEMAADNAARRRTSTPILASALLKLGEKTGPATKHDACAAVALHAAGTDRIRHLVAPPAGTQGLAPVSIIFSMAAIVLASSVIVHLPYLRAVLDGCLI